MKLRSNSKTNIFRGKKARELATECTHDLSLTHIHRLPTLENKLKWTRKKKASMQSDFYLHVRWKWCSSNHKWKYLIYFEKNERKNRKTQKVWKFPGNIGQPTNAHSSHFNNRRLNLELIAFLCISLLFFLEREKQRFRGKKQKKLTLINVRKTKRSVLFSVAIQFQLRLQHKQMSCLDGCWKVWRMKHIHKSCVSTHSKNHMEISLLFHRFLIFHVVLKLGISCILLSMNRFVVLFLLIWLTDSIVTRCSLLWWDITIYYVCVYVDMIYT